MSEDNENRNKGVRPRKRFRYENLFLDIEAQADDEDLDVEEGDDNDNDFIEDSGPVALDRSLSHHLLAVEQIRLDSDTEWNAILARARARSHSQQLLSVEAPYQSHILPFDGATGLWRVPVKPGTEETATFILMEKVIRSGTWDVKSIIGSISRPGCIVVEALRLQNVQDLCRGVSDVYWRQAHPIDSSDWPSYLREQKLFIPSSGSWVRLTQRPFNGDLAYVADYYDFEAEVYVVPRLNNHLRLTKRKRIDVESSISQSYRLRRPDAALLDLAEIKATYGDQSVHTLSSGEWRFHGQTYLDGYLRLFTDEFQPEEAIPTSAEIAHFKNLRIIPVECFERTLRRMGAQLLCAGDNVKITDGDTRGAIGVVYSVTGGIATVDVNDQNVHLLVPVEHLRKRITVGDHVIVALGQQQGFTGWVTSIDGDTVSIYDDRAALQIEAPTDSVNFFHSPVILDAHMAELMPVSHSGNEVNPLIDEPFQLAKIRNRHFVGRHVRVIGSHRLKNYEGIIKAPLQGNDVLVELNATLRQEPLHLRNLAYRHDRNMKPLIPENAEAGWEYIEPPPPNIASPAGLDIPLSSTPLTSSTPLPSASSVYPSPAWNPSSQTPNPSSAFPYCAWMDNKNFSGKRVKVQLCHTKPILNDPGWKNGDYEAKRGLWVGTEGSFALVQVDRNKLRVPPKYVTPVRPSVKGEKIMVMDGLLIGTSGKVLALDTPQGAECVFSPDGGGAPITTSRHMVVVVA